MGYLFNIVHQNIYDYINFKEEKIRKDLASIKFLLCV